MRLSQLSTLLLAALLLASCGREKKKVVVVEDTTSLDTVAAPVAVAAPADTAPTPREWEYARTNTPDGFDSSTVYTSTSDLATCLVHAGYVVIVQRFQDAAQLTVRARTATPPGNCGRDTLPGDLVIGKEAGESFMGLHGDQLFLDSGTGTAHNLVVYDVPTRRQVSSIPGYEIADRPDSNGISLWMVRGTQPRVRCPYIPPQFGVGLDSLFAFDFRTLRLRPLGASRCAVRQ
jgi:hypothetical protein